MDPNDTAHQRKPRGRRLILAAGAAVVLLALLAHVFWPEPREPTYGGKELSEWLALQRQRPENVTTAIQLIGTNGLPLLVSWAEYQIPGWRIEVARAHAKLPLFLQNQRLGNWIFGARQYERADDAPFGFQALGSNAVAAVPELSAFVRNPRIQNKRNAARALAYVGGCDAIAPLVDALADKGQSTTTRQDIVAAFHLVNCRGPEVARAIPVLLSCLDDTDAFIPGLAATALGSFGREPERCVPALATAA